jgi:hypothetical protein
LKCSVFFTLAVKFWCIWWLGVRGLHVYIFFGWNPEPWGGNKTLIVFIACLGFQKN